MDVSHICMQNAVCRHSTLLSDMSRFFHGIQILYALARIMYIAGAHTMGEYCNELLADFLHC